MSARTSFACHKCPASGMDRSEYVTHLSGTHNIILRILRGAQTALKLVA